MATAIDVTTDRDNKYAILRPCCRFWLMWVYFNHDDEVKCGMCRMCLRSR